MDRRQWSKPRRSLKNGDAQVAAMSIINLRHIDTEMQAGKEDELELDELADKNNLFHLI